MASKTEGIHTEEAASVVKRRQVCVFLFLSLSLFLSF
jgi:hypothetical protein